MDYMVLDPTSPPRCGCKHYQWTRTHTYKYDKSFFKSSIDKQMQIYLIFWNTFFPNRRTWPILSSLTPAWDTSAPPLELEPSKETETVSSWKRRSLCTLSSSQPSLRHRGAAALPAAPLLWRSRFPFGVWRRLHPTGTAQLSPAQQQESPSGLQLSFWTWWWVSPFGMLQCRALMS